MARRPRDIRLRPFVGVDGEGGEIDGKHQYLMLRAGSKSQGGQLLETGKPLTSYECLAFLADLPTDHRIYVAFAFDYDVTMMLKHITPVKMAKLFDRKSREIVNTDGQFTGRYYPVRVGHDAFEIDYLPGKEFRVRRTGTSHFTIINDVFSFFQSSFVVALRKFFVEENDDWAVTAINLIAEGKEQRNEFTYVTEYEREYNELECNMLEHLMERFRALCLDLKIHPSKWQGPGYLVTALFKQHGLPKKQFSYVPDEVWYHANEAYYGGRFEAAAYGEINSTVYQYDINSAYASVYRDLPCLRHCAWERVDNPSTLPETGIYFADITFHHHQPDRWFTLPVRSDKGTLLFPRVGRGWYWHPEIEVARHHADITVHRLYRLHSRCDCRYFDWVYDLYEMRKQVGKTSGKGKVLKIALATIYGKLCQSVGNPVYSNPIWAGIIVSSCRAQLIEAALQCDGGRDVLMLATDGLFTTGPRKLDIGENIGQWEETVHDNMFIIMSGMYFLPGTNPKTRGVPMARVRAAENVFRHTWRAFIDNASTVWDLYPKVYVDIPLRAFTSARVANARDKPFIAGRWVKTTKRIVFEWASKRVLNTMPEGYTLWTDPLDGSEQLISVSGHISIGGQKDYHQLDELDWLDIAEKDAPDWADRIWDHD